MSGIALSPAMAQHQAAKKQCPDALIFFRMGDFYELFFDDAKQAARALGITLTSRNKGGDNPIPMAGVPVRSADTYLQRLVRSGYKVAICEQMQDPKEVKGLVDRQVVRVITPGTLTEDSLLDQGRANYLAALLLRKERLGIAWVELSTGAFVVNELPAERLLDELTRLDPAELLVPEDSEAGERARQFTDLAVTPRSAYDFGTETATDALTRFFGTATLSGFGVEGMPLAVGAAGALIAYLEATQLAALPHIRRIEVFPDDSVMRLDRATRNSLELVATMRDASTSSSTSSTKTGSGTPLLAILDRTCTPMGTRLLRDWLLAPLIDVDAIRRRQGAVEELHDDHGLVAGLRDSLASILDLQRLTGRISCGRAHARDLVALGASLAQLPKIRDALAPARSEGLRAIHDALDPLEDVAAAIARALVDEPPLTLREGGLIRPGFDAVLDESVALARDSKTWLANYQARECARTGIDGLKVGFNRVFGYYLEVTHTHKAITLPPDYVRKQTTKNSERYITDELKSFETKVLDADANAKTREYELFLALRDQVARETPRLQDSAAQVARLDVLVGLATIARENHYCQPIIEDSHTLTIEEGRHPVIEATHAKGAFVPNDTRLEPPQRSMILLTGPNMAGKSTFIRQTALITLMAQIGSFVPATRARIGIVDRIFTRVGGADDISQGASTFMVEMTETANILNNATPRSLVILDEVGRGTSTFDGLALAWAIAENLLDVIGCRSLFATHYHQLTDLAGSPSPANAQGSPRGVVNQRVAVKEWGDEIVFLHRIEEGGTDKSYGLHVGRLAGLPPTVLERARVILDKLEDEGEHVRASMVAEVPRLSGRGPKPKDADAAATPAFRQLSLFRTPREKVLDELATLRADGLTPLQALQKLAEWEAALRGS